MSQGDLAVGRSARAPNPPWAIAVLEGLTLDHHRDLARRERRSHVRQVLLGILCAVLLLGLVNVFGQV